MKIPSLAARYQAETGSTEDGEREGERSKEGKVGSMLTKDGFNQCYIYIKRKEMKQRTKTASTRSNLTMLYMFYQAEGVNLVNILKTNYNKSPPIRSVAAENDFRSCQIL